MKEKSTPSLAHLKCRRFNRNPASWLIILSIAFWWNGPLSAQILYNDFANGGGFGANANFTWDTSGAALWNTNSGGTGSRVSWTNGRDALLGNGTGTGSYVATLNTAITVGTISVTRGTWTIANAGNLLTFNSTTNSSVAPLISGTGGVTKSGSSVLTLSSANTYTGATTISAGTLQLGVTNALSNSTAVSIASGATFDLNDFSDTVGSIAGVSGSILDLGTATLTSGGNNASTTFAGAASGTGGLTKAGTGTLTLSGASSNTGLTTVSAGVLNVQNATGLGTTAGGVSVTSGAELQLQGSIAVGAEALALNGTGVSSTGALRNISGTNSYAGAITLGSAARINSDAGTLTLSGGITGTQNLTIGGAGNTTISSVIGTGTGTVTKDGAGTVVLSGVNTYSGATAVNAGILRLGVANALSNSTAVSVANGATLDLNDFNETIGSIAGVSGSILDLGTATLGSGGNDTSTTFAGAITGTGGLTKNGSGTLTLSGASNYTGLTTVSVGALNIQNATGLGTTAGGVSVTSGAELQLQGTIAVGAEALTLNGTGVSSTGALRNISGTNSYAGAITLGSAARINSDAGALTLSGGITGTQNLTVGGAGNTTVSSVIGTNTGTVTKDGAGTVTFSGANTYTGATIVSAGVLNIQNSTGLGTTAGGVSVTSGAELQLQGGIAVGAEALALNGTGVSSTGALRNISGTNSYAGAITLGSAARINSDAGALTLSGGITGTQNLTVGGAGNTTVSGVIGTGTGTVTKDGAGTVTFSGANTYTGATTVNAGTLKAGVASVANVSGAFGNNSAVSLANVAGATLDITGFNTQIGSLTGGGATGGNVTLGAATLTVGGDNSSPAAFAGTLAGTGTFNKIGTGTATLSGNSTGYTGAVAVNTGTLVLQNNNAVGVGTAGTTVSSGATLRLDGGVTLANNGTLTLGGTGVGGAGALVGANSNNRWLGNLALTADTTISTSGTGYLALGTTTPAWNRAANDPTHTPFEVGYQDLTTFSLGANTLTLSGTGSATDDIYVNARMTGTGNVVIDMTNAADVVRYTANVNTYTGSTTIKNGTLALNTTYNTYPGDVVNPGYFGINGALIIGDGSGAAGSAIYSTGTGTTFSELINHTSTIAINTDGLMNLNAAQTVAGLTFTGGKVDLGTAGGLYLNGTVTVNASAGNTATIVGTGTSTLSLTQHQGPAPVPNANRTFNIVGGVGNLSDLTINALITNGSITKTGIGTMSIINSNTGGYEGTTTINNGILNIQHGDALGQASNNTATATTVNSGGTLQLSNVANGNFTSNSGEQLYLNGTGYLNNGALQNLVGNNTWAGSTFLTTDSRVQSDSGTLTLTGTMNSASNSFLDVRGSGNTTISGTIGTGTGGITKYGTGTLTLSGTNTYSGTTEIREGVLSLQNSAGLGGLGTTTVFTGAALHLDSTANGNLLGGDATTITGTGISGTGAIRNVLGSNDYTGQITLAGSSLITANTGTTLTLSGGTTGTQNLTVGTTAQNGNVVISGAITNGTGVLTKDGSGNLTFARSSGVTGTVGATHLNAGTITVGLDSGTQSLLNTGAIDSALGTTLKIGSAGRVVADYASGNTNMFGTIDEVSAAGGSFEKTGAGTLTFNTSFNFAGNLILSGGTLALANGANVTFGNIYITQNMTIDFGSGTSTILSSANLFIAAGVQVSVINWVNNGAGGSDDIWYATNAFNNYTGTPATPTVGTSAVLDATNTAPENQITFTGVAPPANTSWVTTQGGQYYDHEIRPIPEPSTYGALFFGGCLGLFGWRRYRRSLAARR